MEPNQETSMTSSTENFVCPPSKKRQKMLSDKDGDRPNNKQKKPSKRVSLKGIRHFAAQCAKCEKWRFIPSKKEYEGIREHSAEEPFVCEKAREWKPNVTCDDPSDVCQDGSRLWAIDEPNVATPQGWERLVKLRNEGGAYVHYKPPTGRQLRSLEDVKSYLKDHPECGAQGVKASQFSFKIPKTLEQDVRKHSQESQSDVSDTGSTRLLQSGEGTIGPLLERK